jgi:hypothetical protein
MFKMIVKTVVKAIGQDGETLDEYEFDRPIDKIGKDCLRFFMDCMHILHDVKGFSAVNYHDKARTGEKFSLPKDANEGGMFE